MVRRFAPLIALLCAVGRSCAEAEHAIVQEALFVAGVGGYAAYRIPALVSFPCGTGADDGSAADARAGACVSAFAEGRKHGAGDAGKVDIVVRTSSDGGRSWGPIGVAVSWADEWTTVGNPSPVYDRSARSIVLAFTVNNTWVYVASASASEVASGRARASRRGWPAPRNISASVKRPGWGWVATGPGHAVQLGSGAGGKYDGRLVVPFDRKLADADVHMTLRVRTPGADGRAHPTASLHFRTVRAPRAADRAADDTEVEGEGHEGEIDISADYEGEIDISADWPRLPEQSVLGGRAAALLSDDGGRSWRAGAPVPAAAEHGSAAVTSNEASIAEVGARGAGMLLMSFRVQTARGRGAGCRHFALSTDGGESWGAPFVADGAPCAVPDPVCQGALLALPAASLVVASGPATAAARADMTVRAASLPSRASVGGAHVEQRAPLRPRGWRVLAQLNSGAAGYSDLCELELAPRAAGRERGAAARLADATAARDGADGRAPQGAAPARRAAPRELGVLYEAGPGGSATLTFARLGLAGASAAAPGAAARMSDTAA